MDELNWSSYTVWWTILLVFMVFIVLSNDMQVEVMCVIQHLDEEKLMHNFLDFLFPAKFQMDAPIRWQASVTLSIQWPWRAEDPACLQGLCTLSKQASFVFLTNCQYRIAPSQQHKLIFSEKKPGGSRKISQDVKFIGKWMGKSKFESAQWIGGEVKRRRSKWKTANWGSGVL